MSANPKAQWDGDAALVVPIKTGGYIIDVCGSGFEQSHASVNVRVGPSSIAFSDDEALKMAEALVKVVHHRRAAFARREQRQ